MIYLFTYLFIYLFNYLFIDLLIYLFVHLFTYLFTYNLVWLQHGSRLCRFASQVNKSNLNDKSKGPLLMTAMQKLIDICCHEYVGINRKALQTFVHIAPKYGKKALIGLKPLLTVLTIPGTSYAKAFGALCLLTQEVSTKKITGDWEWSDSFIRMVLLCPNMIEKVEEQDKRQALMSRLTNMVVKYGESWHHFPLNETQKQSVLPLFQALLKNFGFDLKGQLLSEGLPSTSISMSEQTDVESARTSSLRHDLFISFLLLHFIGHNDIPIPTGVLAWALQTVRTANGQPTQVREKLYSLAPT